MDLSKTENIGVFVLDSPINAFVVAILAKKFKAIEVIYAIDSAVKNEEEYVSIFELMLSNSNIIKRTIINYNSKLFWSNEREEVIEKVSKSVKPLIEENRKIYFANILTNPVAVAIQRMTKLNHLYHSPADFSVMMLNQTIKKEVIFTIKKVIGALLGKPLSNIRVLEKPIYSLVDFKKNGTSFFSFISYLDFSSNKIENLLKTLQVAVSGQKNVIMLLLAGSEPTGPGDNNQSNIVDYIDPHVESVRKLMSDDGITEACVWLKEHKSYVPLTEKERNLLRESFAQIGCQVDFVADFMPKELRLLPGECIFRYCEFNYIVGEPSSLLLNVANGSLKCIASATPFAPFRDKNQILRNTEFLKLNEMLVQPSHYI